MKTSTPRTPAKEKPVRDPRISCFQTNYSEAALSLMEKAIGQRLTQLPTPAPKPPVQAVDAE